MGVVYIFPTIQPLLLQFYNDTTVLQTVWYRAVRLKSDKFPSQGLRTPNIHCFLK